MRTQTVHTAALYKHAACHRWARAVTQKPVCGDAGQVIMLIELIMRHTFSMFSNHKNRSINCVPSVSQHGISRLLLRGIIARTCWLVTSHRHHHHHTRGNFARTFLQRGFSKIIQKIKCEWWPFNPNF